MNASDNFNKIKHKNGDKLPVESSQEMSDGFQNANILPMNRHQDTFLSNKRPFDNKVSPKMANGRQSPDIMGDIIKKTENDM